MFVFVGLGNPGAQYALNRHNVGFMVVDTIAESYDFPPFRTKFNALVTEGKIGPHRVILCKPLTYMNLSGQAVGPLIKFYKLPLSSVYVVHDDLDLNPGQVKLKIGGSSGGHNGLVSIDQAVGKDYWRLRIGIGHPGHKDAVSAYVLSNFRSEDHDWLVPLLSSVAGQAPTLFDTTTPATWVNGLKN
ncbi:MAG: aminoacyl-tRNA hydrolase [Alphaproteobacteria bacterium]|nr:aminoacyl-tRNA hydrolase [Alphaproteobacteria bacterium]